VTTDFSLLILSNFSLLILSFIVVILVITRMSKIAQLKTCLYRTCFYFFLKHVYIGNISESQEAYAATNTLLLEQFLN